MSAIGTLYDKAKAERFCKTLKREEVYLNHDLTFQDAKTHLDRCIGDEIDTPLFSMQNPS